MSIDDYLFDREALQEYILLCCQSQYGGLIDKPGKGADFYHTCYVLSGLSVAQHFIEYNEPSQSIEGGLRSLFWTCQNEFVIVGDVNNSLAAAHPVHNITLRAARNMINYFYADQVKDIESLLPKDDEPVTEC